MLFIYSLLYTTRSSNLRSHGGEISFPGGKFDSVDKNAEDAALRETEEELGIQRHSFDIWAQLPSLQGRDGKTAITPVIALMKVLMNDNEANALIDMLQNLIHYILI